MAIVIPSKSLYSPIENEKVITPINSVSISEFYTNPEYIPISATISSASRKNFYFEDCVLPKSEYFSRTLKEGSKISTNFNYYKEVDGERTEYSKKEDFDFRFGKTYFVTLELGSKDVEIRADICIFEDDRGVCYRIGFDFIDQDEHYVESLKFSFKVLAVKRSRDEISIKYGDNNENIFSLTSNELLQSSATVDRGLSGIRFYGIESAEYLDYNVNEGYRYKYKVLQGNEFSSLLPIYEESKPYLGWYYSVDDEKNVINVYNLSENTEINSYNNALVKGVYLYHGIDYEEASCTYSFVGELLSVFVDKNIDLSLGFMIVIDFGEYGWYQKEKLSSFIAKGVLSQYENGKETARIRCSVNDYYDENGELAISPNGKNDLAMLFSINDEVIPMVTPEKAMSYKDEMPKVFRVVSTRFENRGALWQELTLQEK